ncbi:hypothetical protein BGZ98_009506 [Dissophora globulifera]|nr:hypothetical protein BGZ98_009506 [Dissophora globulifera]
MAHASSAGAPFDSEVSNADMDSEAFATTPSASTTTTSTTASTQTLSSADMDLDMLTHLLDHSDPSIIAISPLALKLESPLLSSLPEPTRDASVKTARSTKSTKGITKASALSSSSSSTATSSSRKRSAGEPVDKEAKVRERVLRNRAAAQESRDKKRKYVSDIEASNEHLQHENTQLLKRLKTVESDNLALSQRLEVLTTQFAQMQQLLSQSVKQNQPGTGFCQSAVLAKKDKRSRRTDVLTNSRQQKLVPPQRNLYSTTSKEQPLNKHQQVYSMTMKTLMMSKTDRNREARRSDLSAAQNWMETSCRSFCNTSKRTLTLSSSAAASFLATRTSAPQQETTRMVLMMMVFLANILPQLMLNFSTLFLISTGVRSSTPQELQLQQASRSFIRRLSLSRRQFNDQEPMRLLHSRAIKDNITSLHPSVVEEIVTEFRQGRKNVARGLLVKALLSSRSTLDNDKNDKDKINAWFVLHKK